MVRFETTRGGLIALPALFGAMSGLFVWLAPAPGSYWMAVLLMTLCGLFLLIELLVNPRCIEVTDSGMSARFTWKSRTWQRGVLKVRTWGFRATRIRRLEFYIEGKRRPVLVLSRDHLGRAFDPLLEELCARGFAVQPSEYMGTQLRYPPHVVEEVNGERAVRFSGLEGILISFLAAGCTFCMALFVLWTLPWETPIAQREKIQGLLGAGVIMCIGIWFLPRGVVELSIRGDHLNVRRMWHTRLRIRREDIERITGTHGNAFYQVDIRLKDAREIRVYEELLGVAPGSMWQELADFAGSDRTVLK